MTNYLTSDLHIGHANIIEYTGRPYESVEAMNEDLVVRWNEVVGPEDNVFILGDLCMGKLDMSLAYVSLFNGTKYLIPGNHDRMFRGTDVKKANASQRYLDAGIHQVMAESATFQLTQKVAAIATHFPYEGDRDEEGDRYADHRLTDMGDYLLHGHTHGLWRKKGRMIDVGVDAWAGYPISFEMAAVMFLSEVEFVAPVAWVA